MTTPAKDVRAWFGLAALAILGSACVRHAETPARAPEGPLSGHAPHGFDASRACSAWRASVGPEGEAALEHDSFPELDPSTSCYTAVHYQAGGVTVDPTPAGCGYPGDDTLAELGRRAERYERIADGDTGAVLPIDLACSLPDAARRAAARANARTLRALAGRLPGQRPYPYAAISAFGFGHFEQRASSLRSYLPGDACPALGKDDMALLAINVVRAGRAAEAYYARVAPVITVSGGAVHSPVHEAFMLEWLVSCRFGVPADAVLLDPCADHTHTNMRNTGALVRALGGRSAYVITDEGLQSGYLEEWTSFDLIGGSVDQRALRDFGYLLGSFRRASVGIHGGFWYTPYRFWAEPRSGLGGFTCVP